LSKAGNSEKLCGSGSEIKEKSLFHQQLNILPSFLAALLLLVLVINDESFAISFRMERMMISEMRRSSSSSSNGFHHKIYVLLHDDDYVVIASTF